MSEDDERMDRDALLCALVLAPKTFARNRFFALYTEPWARRTRARAALLRTIVRHLAAPTPKSEIRDVLALEDGGAVVRYRVPDLHFERTSVLEPLELAVVRLALARLDVVAADAPGRSANGAVMRVTAEDEQTVTRSLAKLGQKLGLASSTLDLPSSTGDS